MRFRKYRSTTLKNLNKDKTRRKTVENVGYVEINGMIELEEMTMEETEKALRNIKIKKTPRDENIEPEMVKWMGEEEKIWLHIIRNGAWEKKALGKQLNYARRALQNARFI